MTDYVPPLRDIRFALANAADLPGLLALPAFAHLDAGAVDDALAEAARFMAEVIAPTNRVGDQVGSQRQPDGTVVTPPGFIDAYRRYVEAGWGAAPFDPEHGGGGLPWAVAVAIQEMLTAANMAFSLCPMLTHGAVHMLETHGSEEQRATWLPKLVTGEWTGTMCLTEPQAGSDVGALTTRAVPQPDGTYRITGQKIFITWGEHDLTENTVHLVLARTPSAAPGTRGISSFVVPTRLVGRDGAPGERNGVVCASIEHKLGIHASPTCTLVFDDAVGELVGGEHEGMRAMFTMMNNARLSVALEGLAIADRAYQQALAFARERQQGRAPDAAPGTASPIIEHPDVRRMLLTMRSHVAAVRAICYATARCTDQARHHPDPDTRARAQERADLLTPVAKAWGTDVGIEVASIGIQVHGGMGYVEETGAAQHLRDARIAAIYEGTNGIQAIDLVTRKLPMRDGAAIADLLADVYRGVVELERAAHPQLAHALRRAHDEVAAATQWLRKQTDAADVLAGATPYLRALAITVGGACAARSLLAADALDDAEHATQIRADSSFFLTQVVPQVLGLVPAVTAGAAALEGVDPTPVPA
jgi:3-(methylthio)propanoyl-CoA dehydrogenase